MWHRALVENQKCGCGEAFSDCPFWSAVGDQAFGGWSRLDVDHILSLKAKVDRARRLPRLMITASGSDFGREIARYVQLYRRIYDAAAEVSGKSVIIDSSKHISLAACLAREPGLDLRLLHIVRHPVGVALSWSKEVRRPEVVERTEFMPRYSNAHAALQWSSHNALFELFSRISHGPRAVVRYEDFVARPREVMNRIADFIGVDRPAKGDVDATVEPGLQHSVAGNPMRFQRGRIAIRADERWRSSAGLAMRLGVLGLTLPTRLAYGYGARGVTKVAAHEPA